MENRHGLVVDTMVTPADGYAEVDAALVMAERLPGGRATMGMDKYDDQRRLITGLREMADHAARRAVADHAHTAEWDRRPDDTAAWLRASVNGNGSSSKKSLAG